MVKPFQTKENKEKLAQIYKNITGKEWKPPKEEFEDVESLSEIAKLMSEVPNPTRRE